VTGDESAGGGSQAVGVSPAPGGIDTIIQQARAAVDEHALGDAREKISQGLALVPDDLTLLDLGGFVSFFLGDYLATEGYCRRALAVRPDHAYACKGLGLALARQGRVDEGVRSLERSIELAPEWADSYWDLAVTLLEAGRPDEALRAVERAEKAVPAEGPRLRGLAQTIRTRGRR
jgi:tetratricopeptide (TPR) repeat protein